jgi:alkanesulfonate monooxygenase
MPDDQPAVRGRCDMEIHWYLAAQDGPYPWSKAGVRLTDFRYLTQLAGAIDHLGYDGALIATLAGGTDPLTTAAGLAMRTERMKFIIAIYAGVMSPLWLAQSVCTVDEISRGRAIINVIAGNQPTNEALGVFLDHDERYRLADEYWGAFRRLMQGEQVDFDGEHVKLKDARLLLEPVQKPYPELMFGGSSEPALAFAAKHCDTWLSLALPPDQIAAKVTQVKALAAAQGRSIRCGLRLHVLVRETEQEAWAAAQWLYDRMDPEAITRRIAAAAATDGRGARLMFDLIGVNGTDLPKDARAFEVSPHLWGGIGLIRNGPGTTIVGDPDQVMDMLRAYQAAGIEVFILGGYPHIEEAYRFADLVMPMIKQSQPKARVSWV